MSKNLDFCVLLDLYGGLISGRQFEAMDYYYNQDLSLAEIGEILSVSRQAVRNSIKDGEENILMYEEMPEVLAGAMGDYAYMARFDTDDEIMEFINYIIEKKEG